jgi:hypothetical protein
VSPVGGNHGRKPSPPVRHSGNHKPPPTPPHSSSGKSPCDMTVPAIVFSVLWMALEALLGKVRR